ncbi:MAG: TRC40/GET3/ArsA family transport-energizing ATPase [Proteobacteria bacterium]|nr:TRC40/GET3/ArsA family transport-energizing ATPase [Pseudomonadota bacterium]
MEQNVYFFIGKGGVGKSTCSAIFAYQQSRRERKVVLNSIDPAHNLSDIFEKKLSNKVSKVRSNLFALETDINIWVKRYLKEIENEVRYTYKHQTAFNVDKYFKILRYSPGLEEYAILLAIQNTLEKNKDKDIIIFDTPPTALTIKFISLPYSSLIWLDQLSNLRNVILEKKEIITRIHKGKKNEKETDNVLIKLNDMVSEFRDLVNKFKSESFHYIVVINPDKLSLFESTRIKNEFGNLKIKINSVILNKYIGEKIFLKKIKDIFPDSKISVLEKQKEEIIGLECIGKQKLILSD